jgi:hypothetical protein
LFINQGSYIRHPSERKTPPPPKWGEDENEGYDPKEPFYDPRRDPYAYSKSKRALITKREFKHYAFAGDRTRVSHPHRNGLEIGGKIQSFGSLEPIMEKLEENNHSSRLTR